MKVQKAKKIDFDLLISTSRSVVVCYLIGLKIIEFSYESKP
jgi:hypothetical protein